MKKKIVGLLLAASLIVGFCFVNNSSTQSASDPGGGGFKPKPTSEIESTSFDPGGGGF